MKLGPLTSYQAAERVCSVVEEFKKGCGNTQHDNSAPWMCPVCAETVLEVLQSVLFRVHDVKNVQEKASTALH